MDFVMLVLLLCVFAIGLEQNLKQVKHENFQLLNLCERSSPWIEKEGTDDSYEINQ